MSPLKRWQVCLLKSYKVLKPLYHWYTLCNGGNGRQDSRTKHRQHISQFMSASIAQTFVFKLWENIFKMWELYTRKLQSYLHHSYCATVNQLLPGAGRMFKAFWDRSECILMYENTTFPSPTYILHDVYYP